MNEEEIAIEHALELAQKMTDVMAGGWCLELDKQSNVVDSIRSLGMYVERIPADGIKVSHQEQIMRRLASVLIALEGFK